MGVKKPLVSIIMNCYNSDRFLREAIESVYSQTYSNWEIIFWDNASTDNSANIAKSYDGRIKYYLAPKTTPLGEARDLALSKVSGGYVAFLDCDDIWVLDKLSLQVDILEANKSFKMCYSGAIYIDESGEYIKSTLPKSNHGNTLDLQLRAYEIGMQSVLIRNDIPLYFNKELEFSPDYDLMMRIASEYSIYVIKDLLIKYRVVSDSLTNSKADKWWIEMKFTLDGLVDKNPILYQKHMSAYRFAYAKVNYNKARWLFIEGNRSEAIRALSIRKYTSLKYFFLYILAVSGPYAWNAAHKIKNK